MAGLRGAAFAAVIVRAKAAATRNASLRDIVNALQQDLHLVYTTTPSRRAQAASTPETVLNVSVKTWQGRLAQPSRIHVPHSGQGLVMTIHLNDVGEHAISLGNSGAVNVER